MKAFLPLFALMGATACGAECVISVREGAARLCRLGEQEPFAEFRPGERTAMCDLRWHTQTGTPFCFLEVAPKAAETNVMPRRIDLPVLTIRPFATRPKAMGYTGLAEVDGHTGAFGYLAVAEPFSRRGVVIGWITNNRASGVIASGFDSDGRVVLKPFAEYGRMLVRPGTVVPSDTLAIGWFDDCRLGLEAYADLLAKTHGVRLPPQIAGYTTWYPDRFGYSDRSKYPQGCGAGDEASTKTFADEVKRIGLDKYGFRFFQCDDQWQCGREYDGPARDFSRVNPQGPYPNGFRVITDYLRTRGIITGLWWMPFCGVSWDPAWVGRSNLFARAYADSPKTESTRTTANACAQKAGVPFETPWADTCLDMTNPEARAYVAETTRRITYDWGMEYIKFDAIWSGYVGDLLGGNSWKADHIDNVVFMDETASNMSAFRLGLKTQRESAKPGTFILGCNLAQSPRALVPSVGFVDAMRIGGDNGPIDMFPERYRKGPESASVNYFLNGRVWYNDPDPVYVRNVVPPGRARTFASFTAIAGALYNFSDWLSDLSEDRLEILKRTLAPHGCCDVRPVDYFENALPRAWVLNKGDASVFGLYNWKTNEALKLDFPAAYAGLNPELTYVGYDFWGDRFVPAFKGRLAFDIPADDCRVIAVRAFDASRPVLISTSRHVASPVFDVVEERWDVAAGILSGVSHVVPGEKYELRIVVPGNLQCVGSDGGRIISSGAELRVAFRPDRETFGWRLAFSSGGDDARCGEQGLSRGTK